MQGTNGAGKRNNQNEQNRLGSFEIKSRAVRDEQNKIINSNCQRKNNNREIIFRRRNIAGGILSQLIEDSEDQLAYFERQSKRLKKRIQSLKRLQESLSVPDEELN